MAAGVHLMLGVLAAAVALFLGVQAIMSFRLRSELSRSRAARCGGAAAGYVRLSGRAVPAGEALRSPSTFEPCVWYDVQHSRREYAGRPLGAQHGSSYRTRVVSADRSTAPFWIEDATGRVLIDPAHVQFETENRVRFVFWGPSLTPQEKVTSDRVIAVGAEILAFGELHVDRGAADARVAEILRAWKQDPGAMRQFDADGDGKVDAREWEAARAKAQAEARASLGGEAPPRVLVRPKAGRPLAVTTSSWEALSRRLTREVWGMGLAAALLLPFAVWQVQTALSVESERSRSPLYDDDLEPSQDPFRGLRAR